MKITNKSARVISALLKELERQYPNQIPINTPTSLEDLRKLQGHQEVLQSIRNLLDNEEGDEPEEE